MKDTNHTLYTEQIQVKNFEQIFNKIVQLDSKGFDWIFRGQANLEWELNPSLYREKNFFMTSETRLINNFIGSVHHYIVDEKIAPQENIIDILSLMQHHGVPTRLLDFSYSPFVALYFACREKYEGASSIVLWGFDKSLFDNFETKRVLSDHPIINYYVPNNSNLYSNKIVAKAVDITVKDKKPGLICVEPFYKNKRLINQQGCFVCQLKMNMSFFDNFKYCEPRKYHNNFCKNQRPIIKFVIPVSLRDEFLPILYKMNINESTLFPDIDGFARSLKQEALNEISKFNLLVETQKNY